MDLILHIGAEKTGTTTVQRWFDLNARALAEQGVVYSATLGRPNNVRIAIYGMDIGTRDPMVRAEGATAPRDQQQLRLAIAAQFEAEVAQARAGGARLFVISSEHCHSRLTSPASAERVRALLAPHFDTMTVICFLRPQLEMALSLASTMAREGLLVSRETVTAGLSPEKPYFNFRRLLGRWAEQFGHERVVPVPLRRNPDSIAYFKTLLGIDDTAFVRPPPLNEAIDHGGLVLANAIRQPWLIGGRANPKARLAVAAPAAVQRLTIDRTSGRELQRGFEVSNRTLVAEFPAIELADLTPDWTCYPGTGSIDRLAVSDIFAEPLAGLMEWFNGELWWARAHRHFADALRAEALGRLAGGIGFCEQALTTLGLMDQIPRWRQRALQMTAECKAKMAQLQSRNEP